MASFFGAISVETPKFEVIKQLSGKAGAELRKYAPQVRAEVTYEVTPGAPIMNNLNNPFGMLAGKQAITAFGLNVDARCLPRTKQPSRGTYHVGPKGTTMCTQQGWQQGRVEQPHCHFI